MPRRPPPDDGVLPTKRDLDRCRRCELGARATQAVPGEGPPHALLMLVGEQPGDVEDQEGRPFVGPSGRLLRQLMAEAGVGERDAYITNAVKHFSFELRGKRRIHKTPAQREIAACHDWLEAEIAAVRPHVIVALGATALRALVGKAMTIAAAAAARAAPRVGRRHRRDVSSLRRAARARPRAQGGDARKPGRCARARPRDGADLMLVARTDVARCPQ